MLNRIIFNRLTLSVMNDLSDFHYNLSVKYTRQGRFDTVYNAKRLEMMLSFIERDKKPFVESPSQYASRVAYFAGRCAGSGRCLNERLSSIPTEYLSGVNLWHDFICAGMDPIKDMYALLAHSGRPFVENYYSTND